MKERMQRLWEAVLFCMCNMSVLMTLQCLCPVAINKDCQGAKECFYVQSITESLSFLSFLFLFLHQNNTVRWMENAMNKCTIVENGKSRGRRNFMPEE
jgi:hypothetical protein